MSDPNSRQVGGAHYAPGGALQHWDLVEKHGLGYLEGCATKYISRHRRKNGVEDLGKADHYVEKMIALGRKPRGFVPTDVLSDFCEAHALDTTETACMSVLTGNWTIEMLRDVRAGIQRMINGYQNPQSEKVELASADPFRPGEFLGRPGAR
jgi:hypothetical protein